MVNSTVSDVVSPSVTTEDPNGFPAQIVSELIELSGLIIVVKNVKRLLQFFDVVKLLRFFELIGFGIVENCLNQFASNEKLE